MEGLKSRAVALIVCLVLILVGWFGGSAIQAMNGGALITAKASGLKADTVVMQVGDADVTAGEYLYWLASVRHRASLCTEGGCVLWATPACRWAFWAE